MKTNEIQYAVLVYQAGIANVFSVECLNAATFGREAKRLYQGSFRECESFALGIAATGAPVCSMWCNEAGDIINSRWNHHDLCDAPFFESMRPVFSGVVNPDSLTVETKDGELAYVF